MNFVTSLLGRKVRFNHPDSADVPAKYKDKEGTICMVFLNAAGVSRYIIEIEGELYECRHFDFTLVQKS